MPRVDTPASGPATGPGAGPNPFLPRIYRIAARKDETPDVRTLRLIPADGGPSMTWAAGQFAHFSVFGAGEAVFTLANSPTRSDAVECTFRDVGKVTHELRGLSEGQIVGVRGPFGNSFPVDAWKGKALVFVGGGIGTVALRAPLQWVLDHRSDYGDIVVLNGARRVTDLAYKDEMSEWAAVPGVRVVRTVDPGGEEDGWDGEVGLLPAVFEKLGLPPDGRVVVSCGPPVMLRFLFAALEKTGYGREQVVTTLENRMKCGIGLCGRCNVGPFFVCTHGPVITWAELETLPNDL